MASATPPAASIRTVRRIGAVAPVHGTSMTAVQSDTGERAKATRTGRTATVAKEGALCLGAAEPIRPGFGHAWAGRPLGHPRVRDRGAVAVDQDAAPPRLQRLLLDDPAEAPFRQDGVEQVGDLIVVHDGNRDRDDVRLRQDAPDHRADQRLPRREGAPHGGLAPGIEVGDPRQRREAKRPKRVQQLPFRVPEDEPRPVGQRRRDQLVMERSKIPRTQRRRGGEGLHARDRGRDLAIRGVNGGARDGQRAVLDRTLLERGPMERQSRSERQASHDACGSQRQEPRPHPNRRRDLRARIALAGIATWLIAVASARGCHPTSDGGQ